MSTIQIFIFKNFLQNKLTNILIKKYFQITLDKMVPSHTEAATQRCSYDKLFWKYPVNLQENTHAEVRFQ